jgi:hypothetical protein
VLEEVKVLQTSPDALCEQQVLPLLLLQGKLEARLTEVFEALTLKMGQHSTIIHRYNLQSKYHAEL